jgi:hypothetical protein
MITFVNLACGGTEMFKVCRILLAGLAIGGCSFAATISWDGMFGATDGAVIGPHAFFDIQKATLAQPTAPGGVWTLTIDTNYGTTLSGTGDSAVPNFVFDGVTLGAADFLISWNSNFYGVVLHTHNGYTSGDLYQVPGFQTAAQALNNVAGSYNRNTDVWIDPGATATFAGTVTSAPLGNGTTQASYRIIDTFLAPADFLSSNFTVLTASADCANGILTGEGDFGGAGSGGNPVPEPGTLLVSAGLLLLWARRHMVRA